MNELLKQALIWLGAQITSAVNLAEGMGWAALTGLAGGGSDVWDDIANYNMTDWKHVAKVTIPVMGASVFQWIRSQQETRLKLAEQRADYEIKLAQAGK